MFENNSNRQTILTKKKKRSLNVCNIIHQSLNNNPSNNQLIFDNFNKTICKDLNEV